LTISGTYSLPNVMNSRLHLVAPLIARKISWTVIITKYLRLLLAVVVAVPRNKDQMAYRD